MRVFSLANTTRYPTPRVAFSSITKAVLGASYELSVVFVTPQKMRSLNRQYRGKNTSTDILSFPLNERAGEMYFSVPDMKKKAELFGMTYPRYAEYLFIHGLVHLKGLDHGRTMDKLERKYCAQFGFTRPE